MSRGERGDWPRFVWFNEQLKAKSYPSAGEMARQFGCSHDTAQRTIKRFEEQLHAPIAYDPSKKGFFYPPGCRPVELPPTWLGKGSGEYLLVSLSVIGGLLRRGATPAMLAPLLPKKYQALRSRIVVEAIEHHPPEAETFVTVVEALAGDRALALSYDGKTGEPAIQREIEPLLLHHYAGNWYVYAYCRARRSRRLFALDRMREVRVLDETFDYGAHERQSDPHAELERAFGIYKHGAIQWARIRFNRHISAWVRDQVWHPDQEARELSDGSLELRVPVAGDGIDLVREVLKFGPDAELLEPASLRDRVCERLLLAVAHYTG